MSTRLPDPWHDLYNALGGVTSALAVLRAGRARESDRPALLAAARAAADRLATLIDQLAAAAPAELLAQAGETERVTAGLDSMLDEWEVHSGDNPAGRG